MYYIDLQLLQCYGKITFQFKHTQTHICHIKIIISCYNNKWKMNEISYFFFYREKHWSPFILNDISIFREWFVEDTCSNIHCLLILQIIGNFYWLNDSNIEVFCSISMWFSRMKNQFNEISHMRYWDWINMRIALGRYIPQPSFVCSGMRMFIKSGT